MNWNEIPLDKQVGLHDHSHYSNTGGFKDSVNKPDAMMKYVASLGQKAIAFTEHEQMGGHIKYLDTCEELKNRGELPNDFKVLLGNEIYLVDEQQMKSQMENKERVPFYHFILIALDEIGHRQLRELSTRAWSRMFSWRGIERKPTYYEDIEEIIGSESGHVIASSSCLGGYLAQHILSEDYESVEGFIEWCQDIFGKDNFFLEIQPHKRHYDEDGNEIISEQRIVNEWVYDRNLPTVITTDAHYLTEEQRALHKAFLTSDQDEDKTSVREVDSFYETTYLMGSDEIHSYLDYYLDGEFVNECIDNSYNIAQRVKGYNLKKTQIVAEIPLPPEEEWFVNEEILDMLYDNEEDFSHCLDAWESENPYNAYLLSLCMKGASDEFLIPNKDEWWATFKRVDLELEEILGISKLAGYNLSAYFIIMNKFIDIIWNEADSILGISRGSASGFLINYLLEIVQINPLKQPLELEHWRFIHKSKAELADIDIDINSAKADVVFSKSREYMQSIGGDLAHVGTYRTETLKSAIQTACRGLNISNDIGMYLSSLIPIERGTVWTLKEVLYGDEESGKQPHKEFIREVEKYEGLMEVIKGVEGLISGRGVHASGIIPSLNILDCTPLMKAPNGSITTQYDLGDCEQCGGLKLDFLKTEAVSMIQQTMELMIEYGHIEERESLKETYRHSVHPNVLDFQNPDIFEVLGEGKLLKAFQYETLTGTKTLQTIKPKSLIELTNTNSLMRLMSDSGEQPAERYIRLRDNPEQWEQEMIEFGLNEEERAILHEHLDKDCGTLSSQEGMMLLLMDERIANFDVPSANSFRKSISKKDKKKIKKSVERYLEAGRELGTREVMLRYILDVQIAMQMGYGFSKHHCVPYSMIALQEANFITSYPSIYWATAVLMTECGTVERESEDGEGKESTTDYDSMGSAIANLQKQGVTIALPSINEAQTGFKPDETTNSIIFGMKGISSINNKTSEIIIANRPYTSMKDFHDRLHLVKHETFTKDGKKQMKALITKEQMINLIKAGAFDEIEPNKTRTEVLEEYLHMEYPNKKAITTSNLPQLIYRGLIPSDYEEELRLYEIRQYLREGECVSDGELPHHKAIENYKATKSKKWYLLDGEDEGDTLEVLNIFLETFPELQEGEHYYFASDYDDKCEYWSNSIWVECGATSKKSFEGIYKGKIKRLLEYLPTKELLDKYNESLFNDVKQQYMKGTESTWEFESMAYYHGDHEVAMINQELYNISDFYKLPEEPVVVDYWTKVDKETGKEIKIPKFEISQICGVVLGKNKNKSIVTLLTESGTVYLKFQKGQFSFYDRTISIPDEETGKNKVIERSWFSRGNILMVRGIRRGSQFTVKNYKNSLWLHSLSLVEKIYDDGICLAKDERYRIEE